MTTQPEALRLADHLMKCFGKFITCDEFKAAAELRRLHAENERLRETCKDFLDQITELRTAMGNIERSTYDQMTATLARAAIDKAEGA